MAKLWDSVAPKKRKLALWVVGLVLFYTVAGFLILPPIVRAVAIKQLSQQLNREVSIQKIQINPYVLSVRVTGLLIKDKDGQPFVSWDEVFVNLQLASLFGKPWVFKEISTTKPYARVQINPDRSFNFSDLITKFATNAPAAKMAKVPAKPLAVRIEKLRIAGASASFTDLTTRNPFKRVIGPLDVNLEKFETDPENKNPYAFAGTTDAGEKFSWRGFFYLSPLRSEGELTLDDFTLNKYAPLYQDFVRFEIRDGKVRVHANYRMEMTGTNLIAGVTNTDFVLSQFKLGVPGDSNNLAELDDFSVRGASVDLQTRRADVAIVQASGSRLTVRREHDASVNVIEAAKPAANDARPSEAILLLLRSVTNVFAMFLESTNQWTGAIREVSVTNCALHLQDLVNSRPATLELDDIAMSAKNISNLPGTNLTAELSVRWNTNGLIHNSAVVSFDPPTADIQLSLTNIDLHTLDPYLEPKLNLLILNSRLGLDGAVRLRTPKGELPEVTFQGNARLDELHTVDGVMAEDLVKWGSVRVNGIQANLNPQTIAIKEIAVDDAYARLVIETNHEINLLLALRPAGSNAPMETNMVAVAKIPAGTNTTSELPKISVSNIVISNADIRFSDRSVIPTANLSVQQAGGTISGISTEELQRADINLRAMVDNVGPAEITGHINPFTGAQTNELKISVKDVDLTAASPYAGKFAGYRIAEGKLKLDLEYNLVGKKLQSKNVITLDRFTFGEKVNSPDATKLPVQLAVAILKDRDGRIVLDVPIEGSLDDPKFRISKVVSRAILNILEKVATSPFSLLGAIFGGGGEELGYQDFAPGSAELTSTNKAKLDSLVKGLYARPALNLEISGSVDPVADHAGLQRVALDQQLRTEKWRSLNESERSVTTPAQIKLAPDERAGLVKKLYAEAQASGKITPELIAANTNLAAAVQIIKSRSNEPVKGAAALMKVTAATDAKPTDATNAPPAIAGLPPITDPMEQVLLATLPVTDNDLATLATDRAKAVRAYLLETGKVEAARLFLKESQSGGVRSDGSRVYLPLQ